MFSKKEIYLNLIIAHFYFLYNSKFTRESSFIKILIHLIQNKLPIASESDLIVIYDPTKLVDNMSK